MKGERGFEAMGEQEPTVLVVDGDPVAASGESRELESAGFRVLEAASAEDAELLLKGEGRIDLVLMDVGFDAERILGARDVPLIFLYSQYDSAAVERAALVPCHGFVARGADGVILASSVEAAIALHISGRKKAEEELAEELRHRMKSGFDIVASTLGLQVDELVDEDAKNAMRGAVSRIRAISAVYETLDASSGPRGVDLGSYLRELSPAILKTFAPEGSALRLSLEIVELDVDSDRALYLGLILAELMANSIRHAYPDGRGELRVELDRSGTEARLSVSHRGAGMPPGFGLAPVEALASRIRASLRTEKAGGTKVSVVFATRADVPPSIARGDG